MGSEMCIRDRAASVKEAAQLAGISRSAYYKYKDAIFEYGTSASDEVATVKARKVNNATYEAIMIPQRIESRRPFIEIVVNNISYLLEDTFQFKAGMQHTLSLVINSNPDQVSVDIGGEIVGGWN